MQERGRFNDPECAGRCRRPPSARHTQVRAVLQVRRAHATPAPPRRARARAHAGRCGLRGAEDPAGCGQLPGLRCSCSAQAVPAAAARAAGGAPETRLRLQVAPALVGRASGRGALQGLPLSPDPAPRGEVGPREATLVSPPRLKPGRAGHVRDFALSPAGPRVETWTPEPGSDFYSPPAVSGLRRGRDKATGRPGPREAQRYQTRAAAHGRAPCAGSPRGPQARACARVHGHTHGRARTRAHSHGHTHT